MSFISQRLACKRMMPQVYCCSEQKHAHPASIGWRCLNDAACSQAAHCAGHHLDYRWRDLAFRRTIHPARQVARRYRGGEGELQVLFSDRDVYRHQHRIVACVVAVPLFRQVNFGQVRADRDVDICHKEFNISLINRSHLVLFLCIIRKYDS